MKDGKLVKNNAIKETFQVIARTGRDIAELAATRDDEARQVLMNVELEVSQLKSQILAVEREARPVTQADVGRVAAQAEGYARSGARQT